MRPAALAALAGGATAAIALLLAGATGGPYLTAGDVNGWIVVYAAGFLMALVAAPFLLERGLRARRAARRTAAGEPDEARYERWEGAALAWGAIALLLLLVAVPIGLGESFSGDSLAGAAALIATIEVGWSWRRSWPGSWRARCGSRQDGGVGGHAAAKGAGREIRRRIPACVT